MYFAASSLHTIHSSLIPAMPLSARRCLEWFVLGLVVTAVALPVQSRAQDGGRFDGAVWKFKMKLKTAAAWA